MKITIANFGPIRQFKYDLTKDIVVTFGDNNIGKSYAMQVVYLLLKTFEDQFSFNSYYRYNFSARWKYDARYLESVREKIEKFSKGTQQSLNITEFINSIVLADLSDQIIPSLTNSCENTFGNFSAIVEQNPEISVKIGKIDIKIAFSNENQFQANLYTYPTYLKKSTSDFHKSRNANGKLDIYYYDNVDTPTNIIAETIEKELLRFAQAVSSRIGKVYFLPASRSGIYSGMSAFSSIIAELSKNKAMLTRKIELPGISEPISDYFLMLSNIKAKENDDFSPVYNQIENDILHGTVKFNRSRNTLVYIPEGLKHEFEMTEVSSMVSEISPIVAFLKYIIGTNKNLKAKKASPIVFIEEPEAHLHPKNQIKLINLFAQLHEFGVKIVVSSHSNYIFNKLNNLLLKGTITPETYSAILLQANEGGSISSFMDMDELGVDDTNFLDVTQDLYNEREELIASWNNEQV